MQVLVIGRIATGTPTEQVLPLVKPEAAQVWDAYATEKLRAVYYIADMSGAVMVWDMSSLEAVEAELQKLPMVKAGVLTCEVISLKPYTGLAELFAQ
ncbi:MAG: muconolactone Delta-isomerase family protein [Cyanobacteria bacterium P01_A01_bin.123]